MMGAAWLRPAINLFSSQAPASASASHLRCLLQQFTGLSFRSPSASSGSCHRSQSWIARLSSLKVPTRSYRGGPVWDRQATTKRHLYVVLYDQLKNGFEIHKLDLDDDSLDVNSGSTGTVLRRLTEPPVVRVGPPIIGIRLQFAALGSCIIAMGSPPDYDGSGMTVIYDTKRAELTASNLLPRALISGCDLAVAVGNKLYALESYSDNFNCPCCTACFPGGLHCLWAAGHPNTAADDNQWNWQPLPNAPHFSWSGNNSWPPELPFDAQSITAHAVHPRGGTIFVSAGGWRVDEGSWTYGTKSGKWTRRGDWVLPFRGQAHYDRDLDAWVGFHRFEASNNGWIETENINGHLCACRVTSAACASRQPPEWKVSREMLFQGDLDWRRINVQLVYMFERKEYCLVERLKQVEAGVVHVLRLTLFRVKYGEDGELITTMADGPARLYEVPAYDEGFDTKSFWM